MKKQLDRIFHLDENKTNIRTELIAGITTFMTMSYILAVNPSLLSETGMDKGAVFTATALAAFVGTWAMALLSNYPVALAPRRKPFLQAVYPSLPSLRQFSCG